MELDKIRKSEKMKSKMKIHKTTKKNLATMGFTPNQQQNDHRKINSRQILFVVVSTINFILQIFYICFLAYGIEERMDAIFSLTVIGAITIAYISMMFKIDKIFIDIQSFEKEINESKYKPLRSSSFLFRF